MTGEGETQLEHENSSVEAFDAEIAAAAAEVAAVDLFAQVGESVALDLLSEVGVVPPPEVIVTVEAPAGEAPAANAVAVDTSELEGFSMVEMPSANGSSSPPASPRSVSSGMSSRSEGLKAAPVNITSDANDLGALLLKLEVMGFTERTLNTELLEKNEFDLQRTVNDLVAAAGWDPILEELEEMVIELSLLPPTSAHDAQN